MLLSYFFATAPDSFISRLLITLTTIIPKASPARASIVLYPSSRPVEKAPDTYAPDASILLIFPAGEKSARITKILNKIKNRGFSIFPIHVKICPGFNEKNNTTAKNTKENIPNPAIFPPSEINDSIPTVNETVAHLGIAKKGPIVKYKRHVKKTPYFLPI